MIGRTAAKRLQRRTQRVANLRVPAHDRSLFSRQRRGLQQHGIGHADFPDVVQVAAAAQGVQILVAHSQHAAEAHGRARQPLAVAVGVRIASFDRQRQCHERRLRGVERVDQVLHARQRSDARAELMGMDRLREVLVRAGLDAVEAVEPTRL